MLFVCLLALFTSFTLALSPCSRELGQAIFKPQVCGIEYFQHLKYQLNERIRGIVGLEPNQVSQLCLSFSHEYNVGLSIIDASGLDMCILTNPTANNVAKVMDELSHRSRDNRYAIYHYYETTLPPAFYYPVPPPSSPDLDSIGLHYIFYNFYYGYYVYGTPMLAGVTETLLYIRTYPRQGYSGDSDLHYNHLFASILSSVPSADLLTYMNMVLMYTSSTERFSMNSRGPEYNTVNFLAYLLQYCTVDPNTSQEYPLPERQALYKEVRNAMLLAQGAASFQKSFAQIVPTNTLSSRGCSYAYNLYLEDGKVVRIVMNQLNIIIKK